MAVPPSVGATSGGGNSAPLSFKFRREDQIVEEKDKLQKISNAALMILALTAQKKTPMDFSELGGVRVADMMGGTDPRAGASVAVGRAEGNS